MYVCSIASSYLLARLHLSMISFLLCFFLSLPPSPQTMLYIGERLGELKLGNGTSILIFSNIVSSLPTSLNVLEQQASKLDSSSSVPVYILAFLLVTAGVIYVQEAERRIPINYANRYQARNAGISSASYLPFKVRREEGKRASKQANAQTLQEGAGKENARPRFIESWVDSVWTHSSSI